MFSTIQECSVNTEKSWKDRIFITFDMDWCHDEVLYYCLELLSSYGAKATFFATHETTLLAHIESNDKFELGVHPNFNPLLNGDFVYGNSIDDVFDYYRAITPHATSARSHSLTQSSHLLNYMAKNGITHESNLFVPYYSEIQIRPWLHWNNVLTRIPYCWGDDIQCLGGWNLNLESILSGAGLKVFDFHPIHVFLNTDTTSRYNLAKPYLQTPEKLKNFINQDKPGARDFLVNLLKSAK